MHWVLNHKTVPGDRRREEAGGLALPSDRVRIRFVNHSRVDEWYIGYTAARTCGSSTTTPLRLRVCRMIQSNEFEAPLVSRAGPHVNPTPPIIKHHRCFPREFAGLIKHSFDIRLLIVPLID